MSTIYHSICFIIYTITLLKIIRCQVVNNHENASQAIVSLVFDVFYESLCPDSKNLITKQVWILIQKLRNESNDKKDLVKFRFWPYGKSSEIYNNETLKWEFNCHHGAEECLGNLWHTCALYGNLAKQGDAENFIACTFGYTKNLSVGLSECSQLANFNFKELSICANSIEATRFLRKTGVKTKELAPAINYIPWVLINNQYDVERRMQAESRLQELVCGVMNSQFSFCGQV
ncbi:unnamed protein product [Gordionus sp. m RMFG-2023]